MNKAVLLVIALLVIQPVMAVYEEEGTPTRISDGEVVITGFDETTISEDLLISPVPERTESIWDLIINFFKKLFNIA